MKSPANACNKRNGSMQDWSKHSKTTFELKFEANHTS